MQEVLHVLDLRDPPRVPLELLDLLRSLDLAMEIHDAVSDVDVHAGLWRVGVAEQLGLDLPRQRYVVHAELRRRPKVPDALEHAERIACRATREPAAQTGRASRQAERSLAGLLEKCVHRH